MYLYLQALAAIPNKPLNLAQRSPPATAAIMGVISWFLDQVSGIAVEPTSGSLHPPVHRRPTSSSQA